MEIIFHGRHDIDEASQTLEEVIRVLHTRYQIASFREMHLSVILVDGVGEEVELIDSETKQPYRVLEVCKDFLQATHKVNRPALKLVIDNS